MKKLFNILALSTLLSSTIYAEVIDENSIHLDAQMSSSEFSVTMSSTANPIKPNGIIFIDSDLSQNSGLNRYGIGSDYLVQNGALFRYSGNGTNWSWQYVTQVGSRISEGSYSLTIPTSSIGNSRDVNTITRYYDAAWSNVDSTFIHRFTGVAGVDNINIAEDSIRLEGQSGNHNLTLSITSTSNPQKSNGILFIDSDKEESTGLVMNGLGIDFIVQNGLLFTYTGNGSNWSWQYTATVGTNVHGSFNLNLSSDQLNGSASSFVFARYYDDSWNWRTMNQTNIHSIKLSDEVPSNIPKSVVYEDFEDGNLDGWRIAYDPYDWADMRIAREGSFNDSRHCARFAGTGRGAQNLYIYPIHDSHHTILSVELGGFSGHNMVHYLIGVYANTTKGLRIMTWDSFYNDGHPGEGDAPKIEDYGNIWLIYPSPVEHVRGFNYAPQDEVDTFRVDLNEQLHLLEPDNDIISVDSFITGGGYLDNITFSR